MLEFKPITFSDADILKKYYGNCFYGTSEYSVGTQLMWGIKNKTTWAESNGCLICKDVFNKKTFFDYPVASEGGDIDKALDDIDEWCIINETTPSFFAIPRTGAEHIFMRYKYSKIRSVRSWSDYLYKSEDLANFAGRHYAGQRNHIHNFEKIVPDYEFRTLGKEDIPLVERFIERFSAQFKKYDNPYARDELEYTKLLVGEIGNSWCRCGGIYSEKEGGLLSFVLTEKCGKTLIIHIEKGIHEFDGIYPTTVRESSKIFGSDCEIINREEDAADRGLRKSKLQYRPMRIESKYTLEAETEIAVNIEDKVPTIHTERLTLDAIADGDANEYSKLCSDEVENRYWGYDDLKGLSTDDVGKSLVIVARDDFDKKIAINFAIRLNSKMIGEAVVYNFDCKGSAEVGCRIEKEYYGNGYGREAMDAAINWALYEAGVSVVKAKCFKENEASYKMLKAIMLEMSSDDTYFYFERNV